MESLTKTTIHPSLIIKIVAHEFKTNISAQDITPLTAGWFNTAYAIHLPENLPDVVLRIAPPPQVRILTYEKNLMRREVTLHRHLQETTTLPVPKLPAYNFNHDIIDRDYMFVEKLSGVPLDQIDAHLLDDERAQIVIQVGQINSEINQVKGREFGYADTPLSAPSWPDAYLKMISAVLDDGEDLDAQLPVPIRDVRTLYAESASCFSDLKQPSLCHFDLWMPNIFIIKESGQYRVEAVTDWERAFFGDPEADTVIANSPFGESFWTGYGQKPNNDADTRIRHALYRMYLWLVMLIQANIRFENAAYLPWAQGKFNEDWKLLTNL